MRTQKKYLKHNIDIMQNAMKLHKLLEYNPSIPLPVPLPRSVSFKEKALFEDLVEVTTVTVFRAISNFKSSDQRLLSITTNE